MYPYSSAFSTALSQPTMIVVTSVFAKDQSNNVTSLSVRDGSVSMDAKRGITRTADLDLIPTTTLSARQVYDLVMSPNIEIYIERGLKLANGSTELIPLGVFSTDVAEINLTTSGSVRWSGSDRSKKISRSKFTDPYKIDSGTTLATAGSTLLTSRWPLVTTNFTAVTGTINSNIVFEAGENTDPWASARTLFSDLGFDLHFDGDGVATATLIPDPATSTPAFSFGTGATNQLLDLNLSGTLDMTYNGVIATGEGTALTTPIRAEVWDTNPSSPTFSGSGYGKVPLFYSSPLLTTSNLATWAATTLLNLLKGKTEKISWPSLVNPALEPLDVVTIDLDGAFYNVVIDSLTIPLKAAEAMTAQARLTATT